MDKPIGYLVSNNSQLPPQKLSDFYTIGSDECCHLKLNDTKVSPRHCRFEWRQNAFWIRDLRSTQGTKVNCQFITEKNITDGDEIQIGDHTFIFYYELSSSGVDIGLSSLNDAWNEQLKKIGNIAQSQFPTLILGPSGVGKEILAQKIHEHSNRKKGPYVTVNCSALTETLVESELFGHVKGSFTGAVADRKGAFEAARGGTLFLDEIGDLPYGLQAKLLRALENNEIRPVGSDKTITTDVRIVAATHQNLIEKIQAQHFRADLYFRLNVVTVKAPPLRERMEDFEELLYKFAKNYKVRFSFGAVQKLKSHSWPGNIRELKNAVARACALYPKEQILEFHIDSLIDRIPALENSSLSADKTTPIPLGQLPVIKEIERQMIIKRLASNRGNQRKTAFELGLPKSTLHDRLKAYKIDPKIFQENLN